MNIIQEILYLLMFFISRFLSYIPLFRTYFEKEPKLKYKPNENFIVSPASGKITNISEDSNYIKIYIFIGLFDSHIQYYPFSGKIAKIQHSEGKPLEILNFSMQYPAYSVKSANNEMVTTFMYNKLVGNIIITQIAGILANRIENNSEVNSEVSQGEKLGRIIMGSSVILYVEKVKVKIIVNNGDKVLSLQPILKLNG